MAQAEVTFTVVFDRNELGGYTVTVPALPGLVTEGASLDEAKQMAREAIKCYLESMLKDGLPLPEEREVLHEQVRVAV